MSSEHDEELIDAFLDEVLGGRTPPDLSPKIMQAWSAGAATGSELGDAWPPQVSPPLPTLRADAVVSEPPIIAVMSQAADAADGEPLFELPDGHSARRGRRERRSERRAIPVGLAVVAAVLLIGVTVAVVVTRPPQGNRGSQPA